MSVIRIASRYAKSLLDLAQDQNVMTEVVSDMEGFSKMVENRDLYLLLKSPIIKAGKKAQIFDALFEGKVNKLTKAFLDITLRKGRERYLPEIATEFMAQYKRMKGISSVQLITATPISDASLSKLKAKLLESDATDSSVEIETSVDASLIGGFIVKIGDKQIDASVSHKLDQMAKSLSSNDYEKAF
ncbi:MAG: ATP synthase F1 subunit delta [Saprospiraceae bacterium]|nr:ATP synthase F1 subunit delta [Saprospiraceae bacterium]